MTLSCSDFIPYRTFRRQLYAVFALSCIPCFILIYLTVVVSKTELTKSSNFVKSPHRNVLKIHRPLNSSRTKKYASMDDLDKIEIRKKVNVSVVELPRCANLISKPPDPKELRETFQWQTIGNGDSVSYVFSAYYDDRTIPPMVRIIGIAREMVWKKYCRLYFDVASTPVIVEAELVFLPESHERRYSAVFYICYIPRQRLQIPYAVSVVKSPCQASSNLLKILNNRSSHRYEVNFTVCVTPINFHYNKIYQFIEILELNRLFGAEHFVFYNHTVGANVGKCLEGYALDGIVSVVPWKIPVVVEAELSLNPALTPEIHYFGQVAAINDCLYRNMHRSRFLVFTDLDEVVVPRAHVTWSAMLAAATLHYQQDFFSLSGRTMFPGSYNVRNTFFRLDWEDVSTGLDLPSPLLALQKLYREEEIYTWYVRSKHIVWSKMATVLTIHGAFQFINDEEISTVRVPAKLALLHHYRVWDGQGTMPSVARIMDDRMLLFANQLISRVKAILLRNSF